MLRQHPNAKADMMSIEGQLTRQFSRICALLHWRVWEDVGPELIHIRPGTPHLQPCPQMHLLTSGCSTQKMLQSVLSHAMGLEIRAQSYDW